MLLGERSPWNCFTMRKGLEPQGQNPNWFYYGRQITESTAAGDNPQLQFEEGQVSGGSASWEWLLSGNGSRIRMEGPDKNIT